MWQAAREGSTRGSTNLPAKLSGVRVVTAFHRQDPNLGVFNYLQGINTANNVAVSRMTGAFQPVLQTLGYAGKAIILLYGGYLVASGRIGNRGIGAVMAAYLYWDMFMLPIHTRGAFHPQMRRARPGAERVFSLRDTPADVKDDPGAKPLPRIEGRVTFDHVTFGYNPDRPVLHDVCFEAEPGQTFAL